MSDLSTAPNLNLQYIKVDLQTRWRNDERFTHEKITQLPTLPFYFSNNTFRHKPKNSQSGFSSDDEIVNTFKQKCRDEGHYWGKTADAFWGTVETRITYDVTPKRRYRHERTYALNVWYEQELEAEIRKAIDKVNAKYVKKFVNHIDNKIQMADPFYAWVKNESK